MIDRIKKILPLSDEQCREYLIQNLCALGYQIFSGADGTWIFAVPSGRKVIPVLLCAHWDTVRQTTGKWADEPVVLFEEHSKIENSNGILGADDRAGCQLILEVASTFTVKPFILFTDLEESGGKGMRNFINSSLIEDYRYHIYLVISVDRHGHNEAVYYTKYPSSRLEYYLDKGGYVIQRSTSYTDGTAIAEYLGLEHVNVSYGGYNAHTADEFLLKDSYEGAYRRLMVLTESIHTPYIATLKGVSPSEEVFDAELVEEEYSLPAPVCELCGKTERVTSFCASANSWLCVPCRNRILYVDKEITPESVARAKLVLKAEQERSRRANLKHNTTEHPDFPSCPRCGSNKYVAWNVTNAGFVCNNCRDAYLKGTSNFDGIFWALSQNGEVKRLYRADASTMMFISGTGKHVRLEWSGHPNSCPYVKVCAFCGAVEPGMHEIELKFGEKHFKLNVCVSCASDMVDLCASVDSDLPF